MRSSLTSWGLPDEVPPLELAVSELVTNALVHGTGDIEVDLTVSGGIVRLDVSDHGGGETPHIEHRAATQAPGGWGLHLVDQLSDTWGTASRPGETRVWMERHTGQPGPSGDRPD